MNPIKKLASEAGLYGLPSILGRLLNYLLVPLHTSVFFPEQYGYITELYAYVAFLNITYTFGLETAYFRFTTKTGSKDYYSYSTTLIFILSLLFSSVIFFNADYLYNYYELDSNTFIIEILAGILFIDAIVAIPLASLRLQEKAKKFAITRISSIVLTVLLNYIFLWLLPLLSRKGLISYPEDSFYNISYVFWANLIANSAMILILYKEFFNLRFKWQSNKIKELLKYAFPIFVMGMAGMLVENFDKLIFEYLLPENFYSRYTSKEALGIYGATVKLSVFMALAVQAFRYAGEPFFFSNAADKKAPKLFAKVLYYFVWLSLIIWVGVSLNADLIGDVFLSNSVYQEALYLVPILLFGKLLFGIYLNVSIWFKLTDRTVYGIYISVLGALAVVVADVTLIPTMGYLGAAIASVIGYGAMLIYGYISGQKYFYIPYPVKKISLNILFSGVIILLFFLFKPELLWLNYTLGIGITLLFILYVYIKERNRIFSDQE